MDDVSQLIEAPLSDLLEAWEGVVPSHLRQLLQRKEFSTIGEIVDDIAVTDESEREAIWEKADLCALLRCLVPYKTPDGRTSKIGRKLVGWLASDLRVSGQTIRRYIELGLYYPPTIERTDETGKVRQVLVRDPAAPINLYYTGLVALDYDMQPVDAVLFALDNDPPLSPGQLRAWIKREYYRKNNLVPPISREWFSERIAGTDISEDALSKALEAARESVLIEFMRLRQRNEQPLSVTVRVLAIEPADETGK